jgi:short-subunit dehydrogenase
MLHLQRMDLRDRVAIITGASSGIGHATALELASRGAHVVLAARRLQQLEELAAKCRSLGVRARAIELDVRHRESCYAIADVVTAEFGRIDILVNNAGFAIFDPIEKASPDDLERMMQTNYFGAMNCTKAVLPQMLQRGEGAIVNVASIAGIMGFAGMGGYSATKFALIGFTEALRDELIGRGIAVSLVCPATTRTEFFVTAEKGKMPAASRLILAIPPERVAQTIARAIRRGTPRIVVPSTAAMFMKFKEIFPRPAHMLMRRVSQLMNRENS